MQGVLNALGINGLVLGLQIFGFVLLYLLLRRFLFGPVGAMLQSRQEEVESGLRAAEDARTEAARLRAEQDQIMAQAREEGRVMMQKIVQEVQTTRERLLAEAQAERQEIIERGRMLIETERRQTVAELRQEVSELAIEAASRAVREAMDTQAHKQVVDAFINSLETERPSLS